MAKSSKHPKLAGALSIFTALALMVLFVPARPAVAQVDPMVLAIEQLLLSQHYDPGPVDGVLDQDTSYGLTAFQKVYGLARSGQPDQPTVTGLVSRPPSPPPLVPGGGSNRVEIDLDRQVLFLYQGDALLKILPVSTGNGERFCSGGRCRNAITPGGSYRVTSQQQGWRKGPLGSLFNPSYFNGGIAIHGSLSVPPAPASHGCVRIPMSAAGWLPPLIPVGTPVYVAGGGYGLPVPVTG